MSQADMHSNHETESPRHPHLQQRLTDYGRRYGDITIRDNATVILGDVYGGGNALLSASSEEQKQTLLKTLYYDTMNQRKNEIFSANSSTCDWIWRSSFSEWFWLVSPDKEPFWLFGKPGSGKSTMMKYLAQISQANQKNNTHASSWNVISYFFDFRARSMVTRSEEGMVRSLLSQMINILPDSQINTIVDRNALDTSDLTSLKSTLKTLISSLKTRLLVVIDGVDEYPGTTRTLLRYLLSLQSIPNVNLCLASRPEPLIREMLSKVPQMDMAVHNKTGIQKYVHDALYEFDLDLDHLELLSAEQLLTERAEGVFLWVFFAVEELLQACAEGAVASEIRERLNMIPTELEEIYQRIIDRIPANRKQEAAILFSLVNGADFDVSIELLHSAAAFVSRSLNILPVIAEIKSDEQFSRRVLSTLGGLVELNNMAVEPSELSELGPNRTIVRLVHSTIRSFASRTSWAKSLMPTEFAERFHPGSKHDLWCSLSTKSLLSADEIAKKNGSTASGSDSVVEKFVETLKGTPIGMKSFCSKFQGPFGDDMPNCAALLYHAVRHIVRYAMEHSASRSDLQSETQRAMKSCLSRLHFAVMACHSPKETSMTLAPCEKETSDLMLAAGHGWCHYILENMDRVRGLQDGHRNDLVTALCLASRNDAPSCLGTTSHTPRGLRKTIHTAINSILECNENITSFHLAVYLSLGYSKPPDFIMKLPVPTFCISWKPSQRPKWELGSHQQGPIFSKEAPLFVWACDHQEYPHEAKMHHIELLTLLSRGMDIHSTSTSGQNIVQYLVETHIFGHFFNLDYDDDKCHSDADLTGAIQKLYLLEDAGADFEPSNSHRTPLKACSYYSAMLAPAPTSMRGSARTQMDGIKFMLEHKSRVHHLPQIIDFFHDDIREVSLQRHCCLCAHDRSLLTPAMSITSSIARFSPSSSFKSESIRSLRNPTYSWLKPIAASSTMTAVESQTFKYMRIDGISDTWAELLMQPRSGLPNQQLWEPPLFRKPEDVKFWPGVAAANRPARSDDEQLKGTLDEYAHLRSALANLNAFHVGSGFKGATAASKGSSILGSGFAAFEKMLKKSSGEDRESPDQSSTYNVFGSDDWDIP